MKFFVDSADLEQIHILNEIGLVDGVTTNPSIIAKSKHDFKDIIREICKIVDGPVSAEVIATIAADMVEQGQSLSQISENVCVKLPLTLDGLKACRILSRSGIQTNVTLCFSPVQALLAAKCGATFVSPFIGRLDDIALDGVALIEDIRCIYDNYDYETQILAASIRSINHVRDCARIGADVITAPPDVIHKLAHHGLTDKGLEMFLKDWQAANQSI